MIGGDLLHCVKFVFGVDKAYTQTTPEEREVVKKYSKGRKMGVEIGVYEAVNTVIIAQEMDTNARLIGIDPFFKGKLGVCYSKIVSVTNLRRNNVTRKVQLIEKLSGDAATDVTEQLDFIFIDGDHSYEGLKTDWELYSPKLKKGAIILLHDTTVPDFDPERGRFGSIRYFKETILSDARYKHLETMHSMNVLEKVSD
jgi:predicted O-methyltransferase YrrM